MQQRGRDRRAPGWQQGLGDGLAQAFSLVLTPLLFGLAGWWLDGRFGTGPVLAVVLTTLAVAGTFLAAYYEYKARMEQAEAGKPWARGR